MATTATVTVASTVPTSVNTPTKITPLLFNHHSKTIDTGLDGHTLSCGPLGDILQLSCFHPVHGIVTACPFAQFDGNRFHDPTYVRAYRSKLLDYVRSGTPGYGLLFEGKISDLNIGYFDEKWIVITYSIGEAQILTKLWITGGGDVVQSTTVSSTASDVLDLDYTLSLGLSVNRASYGQLTEGGPIPIPPSRNELKLSSSGSRWAIINENLDAMVEGTLFQNGRPVNVEAQINECVVNGGPIDKRFNGKLQVPPGGVRTLTATFNLRPGVVSTPVPTSLSSSPPSASGSWRLEQSPSALIIQRNLEYILNNCVFSVGNDAICFITDHVALPLGWNRDNYWQIRFLLDVHRNLGALAYPRVAEVYAKQIRSSLKGHLTWVFRRAQRPHGYWHRSYLANGTPKDGPVFQQDQQCYPLLELCDFFKQFPNEKAHVRNLLQDNTISLILQMLSEYRDASCGLYKTDETPGDDAVEYPFHFSSHVLLWHTISCLSELYKSFSEVANINYVELDQLADEIKAATLKHFLTRHPLTGEVMFAYLSDGSGNYTFYHDANDVPTLFALDWNFVDSPELKEAWHHTMDFGLSTLNKDGYFPAGTFGGLGSVHTRGPWPLGYAQEFIYANLKGDIAVQEEAWRKIQGSMFWDGLFPEAVECHTGDCVSKAWFSWPGSMIGSALLRFSLNTMMKSVI